MTKVDTEMWQIEREVTFDLSVDQRSTFLDAVNEHRNRKNSTPGSTVGWKRRTRVYLFHQAAGGGPVVRTVIEVRRRDRIRAWLDSKLWTPLSGGTTKLQSARTYLTQEQLKEVLSSEAYACGFVKLRYSRSLDSTAQVPAISLKVSVDTICPFSPSNPFQFAEPFTHVEFELPLGSNSARDGRFVVEEVPLTLVQLLDCRATVSKRARANLFSRDTIPSSQTRSALTFLLEAVRRCECSWSL